MLSLNDFLVSSNCHGCHFSQYLFLVIPDNGADLSHSTRGIAFSTAGDLKVTTVGGETLTIPDGILSAGIIHPIEVTKVFLTGTTASGIMGVY